jgi:hypothetical protein
MLAGQLFSVLTPTDLFRNEVDNLLKTAQIGHGLEGVFPFLSLPGGKATFRGHLAGKTLNQISKQIRKS